MTIEQYADLHTTKENNLLSKINRETHLEVLKPRMLSGHLQGRLLAMISQLLQPNFILEIGTFTGYSALCLAEGLQKNGELHTIEGNEELASRLQKYFQESNYATQIYLHIGQAQNIITTIEKKWDLVFIDADKENYALYYDKIFSQIRIGGVILADNVWWDGKLIDEKAKDKKTEALRIFNEKIKNDTRIEKIFLPFRDGLFLMRKIKE
ncbi:MAG: O-methyltransferase [Cytophagia bacterium]|nr:MAG: O-methyltransferase [Cytophagales bacterium]TAG05235.1 MAG: O-methyltransferase [Cytophagia bacterium]TAG43862.1 MAG: O-methyltransferase [Cytophagia bacterium]TAH30149.1 MAG: O-methyltransferase [Cytophagales bacterium]